MNKKEILLVEDEEHLLKTIQLNLELEGYSVITAINGNDAIRKFSDNRLDLIILDVMLPELSGFDVCEEIRRNDQQVPILFLTAKDTSGDRVQGLKLGADDYLTKPFNLEELLLRVQILLKRSISQESDAEIQAYTFGNNKINFK